MTEQHDEPVEVTQADAWRRLELWLFRECNEGTRRHLWSLFGLPVEEITNHGRERYALLYVKRSLSTRPTPSSPLRSALFEILRRHDVSEQCFAECAALTFERPVSSDMVADECSTCVGTGSVQTTSDGPPTFGFTACPDCQSSSDMVEARKLARRATAKGMVYGEEAAATVIAEAMAAKDAELAELRAALAEADRKNDALSNEWNQAEAQLAELRDALKAERLKPCRHTQTAATETERPDLEAWQEAQSEWFDPTILEIVGEYAAWRDTTTPELAELRAEIEALRANAKANNDLARMNKAQADEFRAKYVVASETLDFIAPSLPVLRDMLTRAKMPKGASKAAEMIKAVSAALGSAEG